MSNKKDFNCETCSHRYCGEGIAGSKGLAPFRKWTITGVGDLRSCPLPMISELSSFFLRMYQHYSKGVLITSGGLLDQPNKYLEAMELMG